MYFTVPPSDRRLHNHDERQRGRRTGAGYPVGVMKSASGTRTVAPPPAFVPQSGPGEYQLTPPNFPTPVFTHWANVEPFVLDSADQFRVPPPAVSSAHYTDDFNEVKSLGELNSTTRSSELDDVGRFWSAAPVWIVWNQIRADRGCDVPQQPRGERSHVRAAH
jgi:hypothetical protein